MNTVKSVLKTKATKELDQEVEQELKIEDPELEEAKAVLNEEISSTQRKNRGRGSADSQ